MNANTSSAAAFLDTLGVNTKGATYIDGYKNSSLIIKSLNYLGIDSVRDAYTAYGQGNSVLDAMAAAGVKFDFVVSSTVPAQGEAGLHTYLDSLKAFVAEHPGSVVSVEGLNEINLFTFSYNGSSTPEAAAQFQKDLYNAVKSDADLSQISVLNLTVGYDSTSVYSSVGDLSKYADFANVHAYPNTGQIGDSAIQKSMDLAQGAAKGDPIVITETGYTSLETTLGIGASETAQAKLILNNLFDAYENGSVKTYLYELFDTPWVADVRGGKEAEFGLFHEDGSPKLAATAVHNLTTILSFGDDGTGTGTSDLTYTLSNTPANTHSMLLAKSGGVEDLVIWAEKFVWNEQTLQDIVNPPTNVTVKLGATEAVVRVYDPLTGLAPIATYYNVSSFTIPLSDHPLIVEIGGKNPVTETMGVSAPDVTLSSAALVSTIDGLASLTGLDSITLKDRHVLEVSSVESMQYMIAHYGDVLGKIKGGYSFSVTCPSQTWRQVENFDANGNLTLDTHYGLKNGVVVSKAVFATDGTADYYTYGITGQTYTTLHQKNDAKGVVTVIDRYHADGSYDYQQSLDADGTKHYLYYNAAGQKLNDVTVTPDGTNTTISFDATGKQTRIIVLEADGDQFTTSFTNGVKTGYVAIMKTTGDVETIAYNGAGAITSDIIKHADGSTVTKIYSGTTLKTVYDKHIDGSMDTYSYAITGQTYTSLHQKNDAKGIVTAIDRFHADGTYDYQQSLDADGAKHYLYYNAAGKKLNDVTVTTDGTNTTISFDATTGKQTRIMVLEADGDQFTTTFTNGLKTSYVATLKTTGDVETITYNTAGAITSDIIKHADGSTVTKNYSGTMLKTVYDKHIDGSMDSYTYAITGQTYTSEHQTTNTKGIVTAIDRFHADGTYDYQQSLDADGAKHYLYYNAAGKKLNDVTVTTDGTNTTISFDATTGKQTRIMVLEADGDQFTTTFTNGVKTSYVATIKATGDVETIAYNAAGAITSDVIKHIDGSTVTKNYSGTTLKTVYDKHIDGSMDTYSYAITGQTYTSLHQKNDAKGAVIAIDRYHADGSYDYQQSLDTNGTKHYFYYNAAGQKLNDVTVTPDGTNTTISFDAATGKQTRIMVLETDGDLFTTSFTNGIKTTYVATMKTTGDVETITYNTAGAITNDVIKNADGSTVTKIYSGTMLKTVYDKHIDGSMDSYTYAITGQTYTSVHQKNDAKGIVIATDRYHADGTYDYQQSLDADGAKHYLYYNAAGKKLNDVTVTTDGTNTTISFDATTGKQTRIIALEADGDQFTTTFTNGVKTTYVATIKATGDVETIAYNAAGAITSDVIKHADGSTVTKNYSGATLKTVYDKHIDGSIDSYTYAITGQTYTSEHQTTNAKGAITALVRQYADGTTVYSDYRNADGSRDVSNFLTTGATLNHTAIHADGTRTVDNYLQDGTGDIRRDTYDVSLTLMKRDVEHSNGTHVLTSYAASQLLVGGSGDDTFDFRTMLDGKMHYDGGKDIVSNFNANGSSPEHLIIDSSSATSFADLHIAQQGTSVVITFDDHDSITFKSATLANFSADMFTFI